MSRTRSASRPERRPEHHPDDDGRREGLALVFPDLKGKFDGFSLRVPTPTVSVVDFTATVRRPTSVEEVNDAFRSAAAGSLDGILELSDEPLVSRWTSRRLALIDRRRRDRPWSSAATW